MNAIGGNKKTFQAAGLKGLFCKKRNDMVSIGMITRNPLRRTSKRDETTAHPHHHNVDEGTWISICVISFHGDKEPGSFPRITRQIVLREY